MAYWWWRTPRVKTTCLIYSIRVSRQVIIKDFTAKIAVSYYNTVVFTFLPGYSLVGCTGNQNVTPTGIYVWFWQHRYSYELESRGLEYADFENHCCHTQFLCQGGVWGFSLMTSLSKWGVFRNSFKASFVFWKLYPKNFWLFLRCLY